MTHRNALLLLMLLLGCESAQRESAGSDAESGAKDSAPRLVYVALPLASNDTPLVAVDVSEWSQNDYYDSLFVDLLGGDANTVDAITVNLEGAVALSGDENVRDSTRKTVGWPLELARSSEPGRQGHRLVRLRPTILWDYFKSQAGPTFRVDSVRTTVVFRDRSTLTKAVALLWD